MQDSATLTTLRNDVLRVLKAMFVAKDEIVDLLAVVVIAQENLLIVGAPGTAKSALLRSFSQLVRGRYFEYLLTRFTEPNEIFGPIDIKRYQEQGIFERVTERMLPEADIAFLDEIFKANSAILNSLLTLMNERWFFTGRERRRLPLLSLFGATNEIAQDESLAALYDRFLVRIRTDNVDEMYFPDLLEKGWRLESLRIAGLDEQLAPALSVDDLRALHRALGEVDVREVGPRFQRLVVQIRAEGIGLSDRRAIKVLKLMAASALCRGRRAVTPADFWIFKHVWNTQEQAAHLAREVVQPALDEWGEAHPEDRTTGAFAEACVPWEKVEEEAARLAKEVAALGAATLDTEYLQVLRRLKRLRDALDAGGRDGRPELAGRIHGLLGDAMKRWGAKEG